jgi:hypothetical protein
LEALVVLEEACVVALGHDTEGDAGDHVAVETGTCTAQRRQLAVQNLAWV